MRKTILKVPGKGPPREQIPHGGLLVFWRKGIMTKGNYIDKHEIVKGTIEMRKSLWH